MPTRLPEVRWLATPENGAALAAIREIVHTVANGSSAEIVNRLYLHGPTGAGKTVLVRAAARELMGVGCEICLLSANDFAGGVDLPTASDADLLIVEDLHHLPARYANWLISLIDQRDRHGRPTIFTATCGPSRLANRALPLPRRLTSRLSASLVVQIGAMQPSSRRRLLEDAARSARLRLDSAVLDWLAANIRGGGRPLQGAIRQLKTLQGRQRTPLSLDAVQAAIGAPTLQMERIAQRVGACFRVSSRQLVSARRSRNVLLPRQVSMYLARKLTTMSLAEIGEYFGGRNHTTVQHACAKVETAIKKDAALSEAVHELSAELI